MIDLTRDALSVAPQLLGAHLSHAGVTLEIVEVEAYLGADDPASHAFRGPTPRTRVMFGPSGHLYVYLSYGMHLAANLVTGPDGEASAVLLRAGRVIDGLELARARRQPGRTRRIPDSRLAQGPGCIGQALVLRRDDSGAAVVQDAPGDFELRDGRSGKVPVASGPRVGISVAHDRPWRFWIEGDECVSRYQASPRIRLAN